MNSTALLPRLLPCVFLALGAFTLTAQETAITYQGRLASGASAANGSYDLRFSVHDALSGGAQVGPSVTNAATPVTAGLFVVDLDFGPGVFTGPPRWLEIGVRTNGAESFTTLSPRQRMAPTPYALHARTANTASTVAAGAVGPSGLQDGAVDSSKIADSSITSADLSPGLREGTFWRLTGNAGTTAGQHSLGTTDKQSLELMVNGQRAFRLEPTTSSPNLIGGFFGNYVGTDIVGATIGGGGADGQANSLEAYNVPPNDGGPLRVIPYFGTIGGGTGNRIESGSHGTISGGSNNLILRSSRHYGGDRNSIAGGGANRIVSSGSCTIGGGYYNRVSGADTMGVGYSTISGGISNWIIGSFDPTFAATIAGGWQNTIYDESDATTIGGGAQNEIGSYSGFSTIAGGWANFINQFSGGAAIGGGEGNFVGDPYSVVAGGQRNRVIADHVAIGGGRSNFVDASYGTVAGGMGNSVNGGYGTIPGGAQARVRSHGQLAYASGQFQTTGDAQTSVYVCRSTTTNATSAELLLDGTSGRMNIPDNATWSFDILVTGRTATGVSAGYQIRGAVARNAGTTAFVGSPSITVLGENVSSWSAEVVADDANDALVVSVTGAADTTIRWVASVRTVEVIF